MNAEFAKQEELLISKLELEKENMRLKGELIAAA